MAYKKRSSSAMRRLHRSFGAGAAVFVLFMVLSGLVINHSNGLGLDRQTVSQSFLLDWYGLAKPHRIQSFAVGDDWLSFAGSQLYLNDKHVATLPAGVGAVSNGHLLVAAGRDELLLLDRDGGLVEKLPWNAIGPLPVESIGLHKNSVVSVKADGQIWLTDADFIDWQRVDKAITEPLWSISKPAPADLQQAITRMYRGEGLSVERVLLDLHSGRIFGKIGVLVYDLLALALGFLSISGLVLWLRSRRNGKSR